MDKDKIQRVMNDINRIGETTDNERTSKKMNNDTDTLSQHAAGGGALELNGSAHLIQPNLSKQISQPAPPHKSLNKLREG